MNLLPDAALERSSVVANCRMNRERNLYGSNGYDSELKLDPLVFLRDRLQSRPEVRWLDLCCGTGTALCEAARIADEQDLPIEIVGVDLAGLFLGHQSPRLTLIQASLHDWVPAESFDLITCVHGLHYVGDKLRLITQAARWLSARGLFMAHLDLINLRLKNAKTCRTILSALRGAGFLYEPRRRLLTRLDPADCDLPFQYLGADDQAGPNYTHQPAVTAWYQSR